MMSVPTRVLIQDLLDKTDLVISTAEKFKNLDLEALTKHPQPNKWCIGECLVHLNLYADYYIPQINQFFKPENKWKGLDTTFKSGFIGNYMSNLMLPNPGEKMKKMKAPYNKRPKTSMVQATIVEDFLSYQAMYKKIINDCEPYNINKRAIKLSVLPILHLNVGDVLRFCVNHNVRHIQQAMRAYEAL